MVNDSSILSQFSYEILIARPSIQVLQGLSIQKYLDNFRYHLFRYEKTCLPLHKVADTHFNIEGDDIHNQKLRQWGCHLAMGEMAVNIVRASGFCLVMYAK